MLRLILGRAGAGKTTKIIEEIRDRVERRQGKNILIVPEQYSHEAERELLRRCGESTALYAEVLSFTRLAHMVARELGGSARVYADRGARVLQLVLALEQVSTRLSAYAHVRRQPEAVTSLLSALDELRYGCIGSDALRAAAAETQGQLSDKLRDLALLQEALAAVEGHSALDPLSRLDALAEDAGRSELLRHSHIYIDGFTDFTVQERRIIAQLWRLGEVTVCLSCDDLHQGSEVFELSRRTARTLCRAAQEDGVSAEILTVPSRREGSVQDFLEEHLFSYTQEHMDARGTVRLVTAHSVEAECELAAAEVLRLVREENARWRDIAIAVRGFADYQDTLQRVFERYGVPLYTSGRARILSKPLPALIDAAFAVVENGWRYEDVFTYLKTGLTGLSRSECDELENYVLLWELHAGAWTGERDWQQHPQGYHQEYDDEARQTLARLNALRRRVAAPLINLSRAGRAAATALEQCQALSALWAELELPARLNERAAELQAQGYPQLAMETLQLWEKTVNALEQCAAVLGDTPMEQGEFARLFHLVLSEYDVGTIPVAVDRVTAGDFDRMRRRQLRHLLVLGGSDERLPAVHQGSGVFTAPERETLRRLDIAVEDEDDALDREFTLIYNVFTLPSETLWLSRPLYGAQGSETRPSFVTERLARLFSLREESGDLTAARASAERSAMELAAAGHAEALDWFDRQEESAGQLARLRQAAALSRGRLGRESVQQLYGTRTYLTASRIDTFATCKFQYFLRYGLRAKARESAQFQAPEQGTFLHYVLENVCRDAYDNGGFAAMSEEAVARSAKEYVERYIHEELEDFREKSARFVYLFRRLTDTVCRVVLDTAAELRRSDFVPLDFELDFSRRDQLPPVTLGEGESELVLTGIADRVDGWEKDGKLYLRVVDYKTGSKSFSLTDVWYGMGLQMLLYLFALEKNGQARYGRQIVPAGVLYVPARDVLTSWNERPDDAAILAEKSKRLRRSGLLLNDESVLEAMEHSGEGYSFLPVKLNRAGERVGDALASAEQLGQLAEHIQELLCSMAAELRGGSITADPWCQGEGSCALCSYYDACHFDEAVDEPRYKVHLKAPEFWSRLEERRGKS